MLAPTVNWLFCSWSPCPLVRVTKVYPSEVRNVLLLVSQSGKKKFFWPIHRFLSWLPAQMKMKTTTELDIDKRTFNTAAQPVWKPELIMNMENININRTLRTLSVLLFFFLLINTSKYSFKVREKTANVRMASQSFRLRDASSLSLV